MADIKISALPTATTPLTGAELVPVVQGGVTKQTTATAIFTAGVLPVVNGGTGTATPALVPGSNVTITGTWPNQTINSTSSATVTNVSVVSANGLAGTVANPTTTPAITLSTSVTGVVKGNGTTLSAASAGTDYVAPGGALGTPSSGTVTNLTGTASININGTVGATTPAAGTFTSVNTGQLAGLRNKIINGGGFVTQRAAPTLTNTLAYGQTDRMMVGIIGGTSITGTNFSYGLYSAPYGNFYGASGSWTNGNFALQHRIESVNSRSVSGKTITVSCRAYQGSGAGVRNWKIALYKPTTTADTFSALTLLQTSAAIPLTSDTFTDIKATFTLGGTDANLGLAVYIYDSDAPQTIAVGLCIITDLQLEIGSVATPFEQRPYGMELALCQRYYYRKTVAGGVFDTAYSIVTNTTVRAITTFPTVMRIAPTALEQTGTASNYGIFFANTTNACSAVPTFSTASINNAQTAFTTIAGHTAGQAGNVYDNLPGAYLGWSAEL